MDPRFVRDCRWPLWWEHFVGPNGKPATPFGGRNKPKGTDFWAVAFDDPSAPMLVERTIRMPSALRQALPYLLPIVGMFAAGFLIPDKPWQNVVLKLLVMLALGAIVFAGGAYTIRRAWKMMPRGGNHDDFETIKKQVTDLLYAAQTAPSLETMRALARNDPDHFASREAEIRQIYRDDEGRNPIKTDNRRRLIAEFALANLGTAVEPLRQRVYTGQDPETHEHVRVANRQAIEQMLKGYYENEHIVLQEVLSQRYASGEVGSGSEQAIFSSVVRPVMERDINRDQASQTFRDLLRQHFPNLSEREHSRWLAWSMDLWDERRRK